MKALSLSSPVALAVAAGAATTAPPTGERPVIWSTTENAYLFWNGSFWKLLSPDSTADITASEALAAGDFVHVWDSTGAKVRKASAAAVGKPAMGFVTAAVSASGTAQVILAGLNRSVSGATIGRVFLSTTGGLVTSTAPSAAGNVVQPIGVALSASIVAFQPGEPITLA